MKNSIRVLAVVLAVACLLGLVAVAAADAINLNLNGDKNSKGEDIINLWDAQEALYGTGVRDEDRQSYLDVINGKILGINNELTPVNGTYYITSTLGLQNIANDLDAKYVLMNDIDLGGAEWTPIADFAGEFDGRGNTVSNFTIKEGVGEDMGFFADTLSTANVHDLHLADFEIQVPADSTAILYIGGVAGTSRGALENCTVDGKMVDARDGTYYRGILTGRATGANSVVTPGTMNTYAYDGEVRRDNADCSVAAVMAFDLPEDTTPSNYGNWFVGGAFNSAEHSTDDAMWRDNSNSTEYDDPVFVAKRQKAVDYMYQMGTVKWSPAELIYYIKKDANGGYSGRYFSPKYTYTGIPYNGSMGDLERALSVMTEQEDGTYIFNDTSLGYQASGMYGFIRYFGSDCSSAMLLAWQRASHSYLYTAIGDGTVPQDKYNGISSTYTEKMVPTAKNQASYGVIPIGYENTTDAASSVEIIQSMTADANGNEPAAADFAAMAEYYAMAKKGDGMLYRESSGHARLLAHDPVVIRDADGTIDQHRSYVLVHEQGDGMYNTSNDAVTEKVTYSGTLPDGTQLEKELGTKLTSWRINHEYTFEELLQGTYNNGAGNARDTSTGMNSTYGGGYIPITMAAYAFAGSDSVHIDAAHIEDDTNPFIYSHYRAYAASLIISDENGNEVFREKRYNGVDYSAEKTGNYRAIGNYVYLNQLFADYQTRLTEQTGKSWEEMSGYTYTFELELSSGRTAKMTDTGTIAWKNTSGLQKTLEALGQLPKVAQTETTE